MIIGKKFRWRVILSLANLVGAVVLSLFGAHEYEQFRRLNQTSFHEGNTYYVPPAHLVTYCIDAPAFVLSNVISNQSVWRHFWQEKGLAAHVFHAGSVSFYVSLTLFWWLVGWRIDVNGQTARSIVATIA